MTRQTETNQTEKSTNDRTYALKDPARHFRTVLTVLSSVSPWAATIVAHKAFVRPRRHPPKAWERELTTRATPFKLVAGGVQLQAWSWGRGPTVLLVHGWEGRAGRLAPMAEPLVQAGYRVVAFDAPAHGESEGKEIDLVVYRRAIQDIAVAVGPVHAVVAHSFGAIATSVAVDCGLEVERLVYIAPAVFNRDTPRHLAAAIGVPMPIMDRVRLRIEERHSITWESMWIDNIATGERPPLLVIHDDEDAEVPVAAAEYIAQTWPRAELVRTSGLGHRRILGDPMVAARTVGFVRTGRLDGGSGRLAGGGDHGPEGGGWG